MTLRPDVGPTHPSIRWILMFFLQS
jgi:hypothetical protein